MVGSGQASPVDRHRTDTILTWRYETALSYGYIETLERTRTGYVSWLRNQIASPRDDDRFVASHHEPVILKRSIGANADITG